MECDPELYFPERYVRIMCDYCSSGTWSICGGDSDPSGLPVSDALRERIREWQAWYETSELWWEKDDPRYRAFPLEEFSKQGFEIACRVKTELPHWTVVYFDEFACENKLKGAPRTHFQYEIVLNPQTLSPEKRV